MDFRSDIEIKENVCNNIMEATETISKIIELSEKLDNLLSKSENDINILLIRESERNNYIGFKKLKNIEIDLSNSIDNIDNDFCLYYLENMDLTVLD